MQAIGQEINRFWSWWLETFKTQTLIGKLLFGLASLAVILFLISLPIFLLSPGQTPPPETIAERDVSTDTPVPEDTSTSEPIDTPEPTATPLAPTETPEPTGTPEPTSPPTETPLPTNTPIPKPGIGLSREQIQEPYETTWNFTFEPGAGVDGHPTVVGEAQNGLALIELIGPAEELVQAYIAIILPDDNAQALTANSIYIAQMLELVAPDWSEGTDWVADNLDTALEQGEATTAQDGLEFRLNVFEELNVVGLAVTAAEDDLSDSSSELPEVESDFQEAVVTQVVDGDTINVLIDGVEQTVRYLLIDAPEIVDPNRPEPLGPEASAANKELVEGETVRLEKDVSETDQFGQLLRYVYVGDLMVNEELLRRGLAQVNTVPPDIKYVDRFLAAQQEAQAAGLGIWGSEPVGEEPAPTTAPVEAPTEAPVEGGDVITEAPVEAPAEPPVEGGVVIADIFFSGAAESGESDEYVELSNQGNEPVDMTGWRINAGPEQEFYFPEGFVMQPGQTCRVYTNENHPETCGLSFGSGQPVWDNEGETGLLYNAQGEIVSEWAY